VTTFATIFSEKIKPTLFIVLSIYQIIPYLMEFSAAFGRKLEKSGRNRSLFLYLEG